MMGVVSYVAGRNTLRVYYSQEYSTGSNKSTLTIEQVTVQRDVDFAWSGNYYADGKVLVNGTTVAVYSLASSNGQCALHPIGEEHRISAPMVTVEIDQPGGKKTDVPISISGNAYGSFIVWRKEESFGFKNETQMVAVDAIPQYTVTANSGKFTLTINRTSGAGAGEVEIGGNIYVGDVLHITAAAKPGYAIQTVTVNGEEQAAEFDITVDGNIDIQVTAVAIGAVYIDGEPYIPYIDNGDEFEPYIPLGDNGTAWEPYE